MHIYFSSCAFSILPDFKSLFCLNPAVRFFFLLTCGTSCPPYPQGLNHSREPGWWKCIPSVTRSPPGRGPSAGPRQTYRSAPLLWTEPPARGCWMRRSPLETRKSRQREEGRAGEREGRDERRRRRRDEVTVNHSQSGEIQVEIKWCVSVN